ncbi:hypothetical protein JTE90_021622 [Oedothorax gibbosus]|uniref:Uncharacterized protein n=1 Tax=Oedothorax gibbosus TaxID=931172 RepID=A0AAV6VR69_9ARAC|nr:hypothetical protein JTE90_021622 [Oedothorax gibbosus]
MLIPWSSDPIAVEGRALPIGASPPPRPLIGSNRPKGAGPHAVTCWLFLQPLPRGRAPEGTRACYFEGRTNREHKHKRRRPPEACHSPSSRHLQAGRRTELKISLSGRNRIDKYTREVNNETLTGKCPSRFAGLGTDTPVPGELTISWT